VRLGVEDVDDILVNEDEVEGIAPDVDDVDDTLDNEDEVEEREGEEVVIEIDEDNDEGGEEGEAEVDVGVTDGIAEVVGRKEDEGVAFDIDKTVLGAEEDAGEVRPP
jgi:hypothetical protein